MKPLAPLLCGLCAALLIPSWAQAETRYVTDQLEISLRAGASTRYKVLKMLPSGTPLEVLAVNQTTKYTQVKTPDGTVGFVPQELIQTEPAARNRVPELEARLAQLLQSPDALSARLAKTQAERTDLESRYQDLEQKKNLLEQQLATIRHASANVLEVTSDRERLRLQVADMTRAQADLEQENRDFKNQTNQRWFLIGAGVLIGGMLLGLILPRLRPGRRKNTWGSL
ncbi:TIGR04211 family SH3 domain-containing protein [uncultured Thiodictyon sp.]|uniref:TIGR04211 family SH3 domain-containing protein n=1 Tax=uncultured Thiodictyon sp. TaxID=1846217 RepID=UPI0025F7B93C|nr:TIGR04211 family SH3 domain-containing protein [uncultured Thiodictyon sp.]